MYFGQIDHRTHTLLSPTGLAVVGRPIVRLYQRTAEWTDATNRAFASGLNSLIDVGLLCGLRHRPTYMTTSRTEPLRTYLTTNEIVDYCMHLVR